MLGKSVFVYFDDILVFNNDLEEHKTDVRKVIEILRENKFYIDKKKSEFLAETIHALGHIITPNGIEPAPEKVREIKDWPTPANQKQLQQFMGLVNYISKYLPNLASIAGPLTDLSGNTKVWDWRPTHSTAFQQVKDLCTNAKVLKPLDYASEEKIFLVTDASEVGTGAFIGQGPDENNIRPAAFHSRKLQPSQQNYSVVMRELLAIVNALDHFQS